MNRPFRSALLVTLAMMLGAVAPANAQGVTHYGAQTVLANIAANGLNSPQGIAVDSSGNLYVMDTGNSRVLKETFSGGTYTQSVIATIYPSALEGIAVDSAGNLYVIDGFNGKVYKLTVSGSSYIQSTVTVPGLIEPGGIAVDSNGSFYVTDYDGNKVYKEAPSGSSYTQSVVPTPGVKFPIGIAVDSAGNVYVADTYNGQVVKETLSGGTYTQSVVVDDSSIQWLGTIEGLAVDSSGNVYIGGNDIVKATYSGGTYHIAPNLGENISQPFCIAVDSSGNIYATSTSGGGGEVIELSYPPTNFGSVALGSSSAVLSFPFTKGTGIDTASAGAALSMGASGEFVDTGTGTCDTNGAIYYPPGTGCTINVKFTPKFAGQRNGMVEFVNNSGVVVAEQPITGIGLGPQVAFTGGTLSNIGTGLSSPTGVAVDGNGKVYIADSGTNNLYVETPSGSSYTQVSPINLSGTTNVAGVAVDSGANVYYDYGQSGAYTVGQSQPIAGTSFYAGANAVADNGEGSALNAPKSLAVDGGGNVYIADTGNNRVVEELYFSGFTYNQPVTWQIVVANTGLSGPAAVAVDGNGNVYIADTGNNRVLKETPSGGGFFTQSVVVNTGLSAPAGLAVDDIGNVYISDTGNARVLEEVLSGSSYTQRVVLSTGLGSPQGLALDASGNLYIADATNKVVVKVAQGTGPSLSYASTAVGSTSSDSPKTVTMNNIGTAPLTLPIPTTGNNPSISTNFTLNSTGGTACPLLSSTAGSSATLAANASCALPISFVPTTSGSLSGSLVLTDNALSVAGSTQTISLNGTGTSLAAPIVGLNPTTVAFGNIPVGATATAQNITLSNTGTAALTISGVTITGINPTDFAISANNCGSSPAISSTCTISVTFTPASAVSFSATLSVADNATGSPQTVALTGTGTVPIAVLSPTTIPFANTLVGTTASAQNITLSNTGSAALAISSVTLGGANSGDFAISSNNCGASLAALASCTIAVTFTPASAASFSATLLVVDNAAGSPQSVTLTGTGTAPQAMLSPTSLSFPSTTVGTTATAQSITLSNPGNAALTITSVTLGGANPTDFAISTNTCGSSLAALGTCTISVTFTPASSTSFTATLLVADNATGTPQSVTLSGTGAAAPAPQAVLSPLSVAFASTTVGSTATAQTITLSNPGNAALTITSVTLGGANPTDFAISAKTCGTSLAALGTCTISVTFTPAAVASFGATLSVADNAAGTPQSVTLSGTGTPVPVPQAVLSPTSVAFASTPLGSTAAAQNITLSNPGNAALTITGVTMGGTNPSDFTISANTCGISLAALATCTISVTFTPASAASFAATLSVADNATGSPQSVALSGTGSVANFALSSSPQSLTVAGGSIAQFTVTATGVGGSFTNAIALTVSGLPSGTTSSFAPASITPGSSGASSVLSLQTPSDYVLLSHPSAPVIRHSTSWLALLFLPLLGTRRVRRRIARLPRMSAFVLLLAGCGLFAISGCAGGYEAPQSHTYALTITGHSGTTTNTTTVSLTIQ